MKSSATPVAATPVELFTPNADPEPNWPEPPFPAVMLLLYSSRSEVLKPTWTARGTSANAIPWAMSLTPGPPAPSSAAVGRSLPAAERSLAVGFARRSRPTIFCGLVPSMIAEFTSARCRNEIGLRSCAIAATHESKPKTANDAVDLTTEHTEHAESIQRQERKNAPEQGRGWNGSPFVTFSALSVFSAVHRSNLPSPIFDLPFRVARN